MLNSDFKEMLAALLAEGAEFLVVGAYAVIAHGFLRYTADFDILVRPSPANARRVWRALLRFGAPVGDLTESDLANPDVVFQIGVVPNRIDIITEVSGLDFEDAWRGRVHIEVEGQILPVIGRDELIRNKRASGRPRDLEDIRHLENQDSRMAASKKVAAKPGRKRSASKRC